MADTPCAHERITTASADGLPSLWYCDDCRRRFYPACETCVDIGHRKTHATPAPDPAAVAAWLSEDDRLARALRRVPDVIRFDGDLYDDTAAAIIRALTDPTTRSESMWLVP